MDALRTENARLREAVEALGEDAERAWLEEENARARAVLRAAGRGERAPGGRPEHGTDAHGLNNEEIARYGRQLILPAVGAEAQARFRAARVLVVGAGGLGAPVVQYLAAAGVGALGVVDGDRVEASNLHRQVIHTEASVGAHKAESACRAARALNSLGEYRAHCYRLTAANAVRLVRAHDVVVDCSDNAPTRYLVSDAAVLAGRPLVSGSALRLEGQVTVYAHRGGPCYRCLFPRPPPAASVTNCSDGGVLGAVTGVVGSLQALETLKIVGGFGDTLRQRLLVYDGAAGRVMTVRLRPRSDACAACGDSPTVREPLGDGYEHFCGAPASDAAAPRADPSPPPSVPPARLRALLDEGRPALVLLDVREPVQFGICSLPGSLNVPLRSIAARAGEVRRAAEAAGPGAAVFTLCRRGIDSAAAARQIRADGLLPPGVGVFNVAGGLARWARDVDHNFPVY